MKDFERKLFEGAYQLQHQINRSQHALNNRGQYGILEEEVPLMYNNLNAMRISYNCIIQRIELRHLTGEYADYIMQQAEQPMPF